MDTRDLALALDVAEHGSLAAAARARGIDPSSASRVVAALEARLGMRLFQRSTRRLAPTEEGAAYLARVAPLLEGLERAREEAGGGSAPRGTLRLTASVAYGARRLVPRLAALRAAMPAVSLDLVLADANLDLVAERVDLAVRLAPAPAGDLISSRLHATRYRVCAAPGWVAAHGRPTAPEALSGVDCVRSTVPGHRDAWAFRPRGSRAAISVPVSGPVTISSALALHEAARAGLGPALLADWLIGDDLAAGRLVDLFPEHDAAATRFDTAAWLLYPSRSHLPAKVRAAIDLLRGR